MFCCAVGVAAVATGAIGWRRFRRFLHERLAAQSLIAATTVAVTATGLVAEHFLRHATHAEADEMTLFDDPGALPLCRGKAPVDRITDLASIRE